MLLLLRYAFIFAVPIVMLVLAYVFFVRGRQKDAPEPQNPPEEPPLTEIRATIVRMRCEVNTYGVKIPQCREEYFITFLDEYGNEFTHSVDKDTYLSLSEGQKGTVAIVNENFYGFAED